MREAANGAAPGGVKELKLSHVTQIFPGRGGSRVIAVRDVSFDLSSHPPRIVCLVGASGSGKSTIARILLALQRPTAGSVTYQGKDIFHLSRREQDGFRRDVQPVFQDPYSIFNPVYLVDRVFWKAIHKFGLAKTREQGLELIERSLQAVRLNPGAVLGHYAHQLSGGQRQRVMLARVHMLRPSFIIADEPVSMLDAQVRRSFLDLLIEFQDLYGMTTLFITHDLSTVAYVGGEMKTIFHGSIVEEGTVEQVMTHPTHPYTKLLLASVPVPDPDQRWTDRVELVDGTPRIVPLAKAETTADRNG
ncbi:MAG TPA: ATP-binding cassette domain-containing protein [Candidatus Dormibacteraeota bacterium]|jgi:peptide/nickel transport system ATP-binding protein|nr:ATP-binding cassette domain-containing protein [Candidatus Dormibacteraeota bacterium]